MELTFLIETTIALGSAVNVTGLCANSKQVQPGDLFICAKYNQVYIAEAIANGAVAVLKEGPQALTYQSAIPIISSENLSEKLPDIAARFNDYPARNLSIIGVTGTSGKTSCTQFMAQIATSLGIKCGVVGTLGSGIYGELSDTGFTTPDAIALQKILKKFVAAQVNVVFMEVSSHSIAQRRIQNLIFASSIFTNLSQDHLDYHENMLAYAAIKESFFTDYPTENTIINLDDEVGKTWLQKNTFTANRKIFTYSTKQAHSKFPHIYAENYQPSDTGISAIIHSPWGSCALELPLIGEYNLSNSLSIIPALCDVGLKFAAVIAQLQNLQAVSGRMELFGGGGAKPLVVVDYAHKPDALEKVLQALRSHTRGSLICVFGCGGDRDSTKRPLMAAIAEKFSDKIIVTNDNPRTEDPTKILTDIMQGFSDAKLIHVELDRAKAIAFGIKIANATDCVLIAGKGGETYQTIGTEKFPFNDVHEVEKCLQS